MNEMSRELSSNQSHPLDQYMEEQSTNQPSIVEDFKTQLSNEDKKKIESISQQIQPLDHDGLLQFGTQLQQNMSQFSHRMLDEVQSKDMGPVGDVLNQLMGKLKSVNRNELNPEKQSKLKRFFRRTKASINEIFSRMQSVSSQIDRITIQLEKHKGNLTKNVELLDGLYKKNKNYFDGVTLYIEAAKRKNKKFKLK
ncbi:tellurite resistance protein [Staphylococcus saccharolyticus]|uniref:Tellurite resistance protein n=1 Tax=Staphylococcus saccharolyticus TaxID=33028 RepID=A0A380H441_9STAP|nr:tellurite resistance protein [Staphylococcus saccharolyticus]